MPKEVMGVNAAVLKEIKTLFQETSVEEIELEEQENFYLRVSRKKPAPQFVAAPAMQVAAAPAAAQAAAPAAAPAVPQGGQYDDESKYHKVQSPVIGTYYSASSPGADPFVKVGDSVSPDTTVCIIEAMKVMNEIKADAKGKVVHIAKSNGDSALSGDVLVVIQTA